jgi:SAM-dependent methyltransferase
MAIRSTKPYCSFAQVYDRIMADVPYRMWADYFERVWARHSFAPETILDLACGTGNFSLELASRGYQVTGVDLSSDMLELARKKCRSLGIYVDFHQSDIRDLKLNRVFDGATCVFDSLNYLLEPSSLKQAFKTVAQHLKKGGLFVFDVNTQERLAAIPTEISIFEGQDYYVVWGDTYNKQKSWWQVRLTGFIKDGEVWRRFDEIHRERAFPLMSIKDWLKDSQFDVLGVYDSCTFIEASNDTSRAYFVARRV